MRAPRVEVERLRSGEVVLRVDGQVRATRSSEYRVSEASTLVAARFVVPSRVLVFGGADGLVVRRLLALPEVTAIVVVDPDADLVRAARVEPDLREMNGAAFDDHRVRVVLAEPWDAVGPGLGRFDLVVYDTELPLTPEAGRIYTVEFFERLAAVLSDEGVVVVPVPLLPDVASLLCATLGAVFSVVRPYRPMADRAWGVASRHPLEPRTAVPDWTRFLTEDLAVGAFALPKDEEAIWRAPAEPHRLGDSRLVRRLLASTYGLPEARPYAYREGYWVAWISESSPLRLDQLALLVDEAAERRDVVLLVDQALQGALDERLAGGGLRRVGHTYVEYLMGRTPEDLARIAAEYERIDDGSVAEIEVLRCAATEHPDVRHLLDAYLRGYADRLFDLPHCSYPFDERATWLVARAPDRRAVALFKILEAEVPTVELMYGDGSPWQHMLSLLLAVQYLRRAGAREVRFPVAEEAHRRVLERFGARRATGWDVWNHPASDVPDTPAWAIDDDSDEAAPVLG